MFLAFSFNVGIIIVKRYERVAETKRDINYYYCCCCVAGLEPPLVHAA